MTDMPERHETAPDTDGEDDEERETPGRGRRGWGRRRSRGRRRRPSRTSLPEVAAAQVHLRTLAVRIQRVLMARRGRNRCPRHRPRSCNEAQDPDHRCRRHAHPRARCHRRRRPGPPSSAAKAASPSVACQQAGVSTLQSLGLLPAVARGGIEVKDVGVLAFPTVLSLHRTDPELFQTGGVTVIVGGTEVPATWC